MSDFLPDYSTMPHMGQYAALWRLKPDAEWRYVRKDGQPIVFPTRSQALAAAKECVRRILNPPVRVSRDEGTSGADLVTESRVARLRAQSEAQKEAFGGVIVKGKLTKVEEKGSAKRTPDRA